MRERTLDQDVPFDLFMSHERVHPRFIFEKAAFDLVSREGANQASADADLRLAPHELHLQAHTLRMADVIRIHAGDEFAPAFPQPGVQGSHQA